MRKALVVVLLCALASSPLLAEELLRICSFNIQFLGHFKNRDNVALASILREYDIVVVQELVAPPYSMTFPDGTGGRADAEARAFFDAMICNGFSYQMSEEDTGPGERNHTNTTATEWWVAFYKPDRVLAAPDLPSGFLAEDRSANPSYARVPYAFAFRSMDTDADFVLISVHLDPDSSQRRQEELASIAEWIAGQTTCEKDFLVVGDMNIQSCEELARATPPGFTSLNSACAPTNTAETGRPYDHVLYRSEFTSEMLDAFVIIDLVEAMRAFWSSDTPYPGDPYDHNAFRVTYSDHHPIVFSLAADGFDDD